MQRCACEIEFGRESDVIRVDCDCNRPSYLATVFNAASAFNGDLNQWNVATVTTMQYSKSIRIWRMTCLIVGFSRGFGLVVMI